MTGTAGTDGPGCRLRLGDALLGLEGDLVTVAAPRWEPGLFLKHVEHLDAELLVGVGGTASRLRLSSGGGPVPWQVLVLDVPTGHEDGVRAFLAAVERARSASRAADDGG